ncbi:MAG: aldo/keto reductase [Actinobacteria bacterium]|nr:aldo/keto reductase [Actinomycetota bacterium]
MRRARLPAPRRAPGRSSAPRLSRGGSERVLGRWLRDSGRRDDVAVLTKGAHPDADRRRVTPADISTDLLESLDVLGAGPIEIYMLHRDDPSRPVGPLVEVLNEHRRAGRIRAFGGSNWTTRRLEEANDYARAHGLEPFSCSSPGLSLARQNEPPWPDCVAADDGRSRAWYEWTKMPVFAWSSQAGGFFAGARAPDVARVYGSEPNLERLRRAAELGERIDCTANEVALAWVLGQPFPTHAIIGPRTVDELRRSVGALEIELTDEERLWLDLR